MIEMPLRSAEPASSRCRRHPSHEGRMGARKATLKGEMKKERRKDQGKKFVSSCFR